MTQSSDGAPVGGGDTPSTPGGSGGSSSPTSGTDWGLTPYGSYAPPSKDGEGGWARKNKETPLVEIIQQPKATPRARTAFKPKTTLSRARGKIDVPRGTRIAGRKVDKVDLDRLLATNAEKLSFLWFSENNIPFDFETSLLGGRLDLNKAETPFLLSERLRFSNYQAMRFYEQNNNRMEIEKDFLSSCGYEVIDISPMKLLEKADSVLAEVMELGEGIS